MVHVTFFDLEFKIPYEYETKKVDGGSKLPLSVCE